MNKARITYRLNRETGNEQRKQGEQPNIIPLFGEEYTVIEEPKREAESEERYFRDEPLSPPDRDASGYDTWSSPFDAETERIERLIRETNERRRPADEPLGGGWRNEARAGEPRSGSSGGWRDEARAGEPRSGSGGGWRDEVRAGEPRRSSGSYVQPKREAARELPTDVQREMHPQLGRDLHPDPLTNEWQPVYQEPLRESWRPSQREQERDRHPAHTMPAGAPDVPVDDWRERPTGDRAWRGTGYADRRSYETRREVPVTGPRYVRHSSTSWLKIAATVIGAIVTGGLLGLLVLSLFSGQSFGDLSKLAGGGSNKQTTTQPQKDDVVDTSAPAAKTSTSDVKTTDKQPVAASANLAVVNIPAKSYVFLQNGGFSNSQGAETAQTDLRKQGFAAVTEAADKYFVYAGVAPSRDDALALSKQLQAKKIDIYLKTVTLPAMTKIKWNGKSDAVQLYLTQGDKLVQMISALTLLKLEADQPTPLEDASYQALKSAHESWSQLSAGMNDGVPQDAKTYVQKMNNALDTAKLSIDEYKKNRSTAMLWQAQSNVMEYIVAEKKFLQTVAPD